MASLSIHFFMQLMFDNYIIGSFLVGLLSSISIFLPSPSFLIIFSAAPFFNPIFLGIAAGFGAAVGELTGYGAGLAGKKTLLKRYKKQTDKLRRSFKKYHPSMIIYLISVSPLPFDFVGIFCGVIKYSFKKFFLATLFGKIIKYWAIAYAGFYGMSWAMQYFGAAV